MQGRTSSQAADARENSTNSSGADTHSVTNAGAPGDDPRESSEVGGGVPRSPRRGLWSLLFR